MMCRVFQRLLLLIPLVAGCTYHRTLFSPLRAEDGPSGEVVHRFTMIRARSVPPFVDHEWDLNLAIPASRICEGGEVRVPGAGVVAVFSEWRHPGRVVAVPTGTLRFVQIRPDAVQVEVNMSADVPSRWSVRRLVWFRYDPQAAVEMPWIRSDTTGEGDDEGR
jgi:hypothetical protein